MKMFLILLMILNAAVAHAGPEWAYCNGSKQASKKVEKMTLHCPGPVGGPHLDFDRCEEIPSIVNVRAPELDYICSLPTAAESDDPELRNTMRCINADKKHCQFDGGGVPGPGDHSIPKDAWYKQTGVTKAFPDIRCQCGCFVGETYIAGVSGPERIDALAERAKAMPVGVRVFSQTKGQTFSQPLNGPDFTVGPEEKPLIRIATVSGVQISVTELHPILAQRNDSWTMIQAKNLETADILMDEEGKIDAVLSLESYKLDPASAKVYNLDTRAADPEEHVISANKILVGDIYWQKRLSEESSRIDNMLASAQQK